MHAIAKSKTHKLGKLGKLAWSASAGVNLHFYSAWLRLEHICQNSYHRIDRYC